MNPSELNTARSIFFRLKYLVLWSILVGWIGINSYSMYDQNRRAPTDEEVFVYNSLIKNKACQYEKIPEPVTKEEEF